MFIIESTSKYGNKVYRVDRKKCPYRYWSSDISKAYLYNKEEIATQECNHLKYGNPKVREIDAVDDIMITIGKTLNSVYEL